MADFIALDVNFQKTPQETEDIIKKVYYEDPELTNFFGDVRTGLTKNSILLNFKDRSKRLVRAAKPCQEGDYVTGEDIFQKELSLCDFEVNLKQCTSILYDTVWQKQMGKGPAQGEITGTILEDLITEDMMQGVSKDIKDVAFFGDTALAGNEEYKKPFKVCDGIWKKIIANVIALKTKHFDVDDNALVADEGISILNNILKLSTPELKKDKLNGKFWVTGTIYDNIEETYSKQCCTELQFKNLVDGIPSLTYKGFEIIPMYGWDEVIEELVLGSPHRAIFSTKENFVWGLKNVEEQGIIDSWYEKKEKQNYFRMWFSNGNLIKWEDRMVVAY